MRLDVHRSVSYGVNDISILWYGIENKPQHVNLFSLFIKLFNFVMESILCETTSVDIFSSKWKCLTIKLSAIGVNYYASLKVSLWTYNKIYMSVSFFCLSEKPDRKWTFEIHVNSFLLLMYGIYMKMKTRYILLNLFYTTNICKTIS